MICDVHAHYIPQKFSDFMRDRFPPRVGVPGKVGIARHPVSDSPPDIQGRFELMDAAGVERQILSPHRYPSIRFIVPHLGGPIPMLLNRLDMQGVRDLGGLAGLPA